ncbi:MAG: DNA-directed RNA polymerase subunit beta' [Patescibacteria group bacterium]|nr:DNA-directed RNA polymerase subunit beta' [Patescibacteria group bacterium]
MKNLNDLSDFKSLRITLASPQEILSWSHGEVTKPETINYRTFRPEKDGLFDERIFGPTKDYECYCGKYKRIRYKGVICDKCGVEVTHSRVRRERVGHITLSSPVAHVWYFRGIPSQLGILLEVSPRDLESVIYFSSYLVTEVAADRKAETVSLIAKELEAAKEEIRTQIHARGQEISGRYEKERERVKKEISDKGKLGVALEEIGLREKKELEYLRQEGLAGEEEREKVFRDLIARIKSVAYLSTISETEYFDLGSYLERFASLTMGAEALLKVLNNLNLAKLSEQLRKDLSRSFGQRRVRVAKRLRVVEGFRSSGVNPAWTVLNHLVVIPPELRPMVQLEGGRFATSDLNDLYRRVINRNNRLKKLLDLGAPEIIIRNEKRMLQEAVDSLIDSSKQRTTAKPMRGRQELRSLSDMLKGKQGRFRKNLLGKRVDYSGRSVIVVGPHLKLDQCGLPKEMALELFKPFVLGEILKRGLAPNLKSARFVLDERGNEIWDILENLVERYPVMLNRAPTLHRLGIQAFYPILVDGSAIQLHPCVCGGFNADFDGDQMAVHVPLSQTAKTESESVMLSTKNLISPASGTIITLPNREMLIGCYYLTSVGEKAKTFDKIFADFEEAKLAYYFGRVGLRDLIKLKLESGEVVETTVGRVIFNSVLPEKLRFFNQETNKENNVLRKFIEQTLESEGREAAVSLIDSFKSLGFHYATLAGLSMGLPDCVVPVEKEQILSDAEAKVADVDRNFRRGLVTKREKLRLSEGVWTEVTNRLDELSRNALGADNPLRAMVVSGARGTWDQVKQICGARGLIVDPLGRLVELPIKSNYLEGLSGFEYFASARGARKGLVDTALKTADAGYLTRRLVDVAQDVIVREEDCGSEEGLEIVRGEEHTLTTFSGRLYGRVLARDLVGPKGGKKVLLKRNTILMAEELKLIEEAEVERVLVRSAITCEAEYGICSLCYGLDLATKQKVAIGVPVGIIAAQSIGEPGTQLTLRTKHFSGIVTSKDVTQGLPRVEEVFEARTPKFLGVISETAGVISIKELESKRAITVKSEKDSGFEDKTYEIDLSLNLMVKEGDLVGVGTQLCEGYLDLPQLLRSRGYMETAAYIIGEIQKVYSSQGVALNDKHIEIIVRQMFSRVRIDESGSTKFLPGEVASKSLFREENKKVLEKGADPATAEAILLGITKAALATESFLAAASFIETTRELTEASVSGKVDRLLGLKENVIIGRLIPVGERARIK